MLCLLLSPCMKHLRDSSQERLALLDACLTKEKDWRKQLEIDLSAAQAALKKDKEVKSTLWWPKHHSLLNWNSIYSSRGLVLKERVTAVFPKRYSIYQVKVTSHTETVYNSLLLYIKGFADRWARTEEAETWGQQSSDRMPTRENAHQEPHTGQRGKISSGGKGVFISSLVAVADTLPSQSFQTGWNWEKHSCYRKYI